jgi:hypothetical protein
MTETERSDILNRINNYVWDMRKAYQYGRPTPEIQAIHNDLMSNVRAAIKIEEEV